MEPAYRMAESELLQIGELLAQAGVVSQEQLREGMRRAAETELPLGTILVWSGYLSDQLLESAIHVQSLLTERRITVDDAIAWLAREADLRILTETAKQPVSERQATTDRLGQLLVEAGMIAEDTLNEAVASSLTTGLPLGRVLAYTAGTPERNLSAALDAQMAIREGQLQQSVAVSALKIVKEQKTSFEKALAQLGALSEEQSGSPLASLLRDAGVLSEARLATAQEMALSKEKELETVLTEFNFVAESIVRIAVNAGLAVKAGTIPRSRAIAMVKRAVETSMESTDPVGPLDLSKVPLSAADLLRMAGLFDAETSTEISPAELQSSLLTDERASADPDETIALAVRCMKLVEKQTLSPEQAVMVLHYCCRKGLQLDDVFRVMGIES